MDVRVTRPAVSYSHTQSQSSSGPNVILYLPPGPLFQGLDASPIQTGDRVSFGPSEELGLLNADSPQHLLASATSTIVVTVNYRLGNPKETNALPESSSKQEQAPSPENTSSATAPQTDFYKYPTPVHDTLAGFDWIQNHLKPAHLAIFGSHIGGSLALMLALTEAQSVKAVAAHEPTCDWPGLDEYCAIEYESVPSTERSDNSGTIAISKRTPKKASRSSTPADLIPLLEAREQYFASPERCFDAFASPILFLRSAGCDIPRVFPRYLTGPEYPVPTLKYAKSTSAEQHAASDGSLWDGDIYPYEDAEDLGSSARVVRRRKALSRWPPYGLDYGLSGQTWSGPGRGIGRLQVTLPWVNVFIRNELGSSRGSESMGRSTARKDSYVGRTVLARQGEEMVSVMRRACFWGREKGFGERKVTLSRIDGDSVQDAGAWLGSVFDGSIEED